MIQLEAVIDPFSPKHVHREEYIVDKFRLSRAIAQSCRHLNITRGV